MFNPFDKPVTDLEEQDLEKLVKRHISEGLYIEYKSGFPIPTKIAHSIASFANTHGGWYIVGIKTDANNQPQSIDGFDLSSIPNPKEHLREIVKSHIDPVPFVESKLLALSTGKAVLAACIPESLETPHITKDGRIYRRNAEGSDPIPENDRYVIDQLYERGKQFKDRLRRFCRSEFTVSKAQEKQGWLVAYLIPYPMGLFKVPNFTKERLDNLKALFTDNSSFFEGKIQMGIPFQVIQSSLDSLILRSTERQHLADLWLTVRIHNDGAAKLIIPLPYLNIHHPLQQEYKSSTALSKLVSLLPLEDIDLFRIIDGYRLFTVFLVLTGKYLEFLRRNGWSESELLIAYEIQESWRNILFLDSDSFIEQLQTYGVPVCLESNGFFPPHLDKEAMIVTVDPRKPESLIADLCLVCAYFGVFTNTLLGSIESWINYFIQISTKTS